jgi:hypothetical protein
VGYRQRTDVVVGGKRAMSWLFAPVVE